MQTKSRQQKKIPTKGKFTDTPKKHFLKKKYLRKKKRKNLTKQNKTKQKQKQKNKKTKQNKKNPTTTTSILFLISLPCQGNDIKNKMLGVVLELPTDVETI